MDTSPPTRDLNQPRCGPCWRSKKGCDGNWPRCKRCELTGRDCDWPEEAQYSSSPTKDSFLGDQAKEKEVHHGNGMSLPARPKRKRVPPGERVGRKVIRVPRSPPGYCSSERLPATEPNLNDGSQLTVKKTTNPAVEEIMSDAELESIAKYHRSFLQAQQDYVFAQRGDNPEEIEKTRSALKTFEEQFDRVSKEYEEFLKTVGPVVDVQANQRSNAIDLPWDKYLDNFHRACDGSFKDDEGNAVVPYIPDMNVDRSDPGLANFTLGWEWSAELRNGSINPALPPMAVDHPNLRQAVNPRLGRVETEDTEWPTFAQVDADELFAGEGDEQATSNECDEVFAALETVRLSDEIARELY